MTKIHLETIPNRFEACTELKSDTTRLLFVEGVSDANIIEHLLKENATGQVVQIVATSGQFQTTEPERLERLLATGVFSVEGVRVGLIADTDKHSPKEKLSQIKELFKANQKLAYGFTDLDFDIWTGPHSTMTAFSLFLVPQAYTAGAKVINLDANRHGAMELYFLEHYQDDAHLVQCGQFIQDLFNEPWWSAETGFDPFSLKDGQEKWLSSALLLARGSKALLKKCRTDIGLATDKKQIKPSQWKNLDALKDYLTAFLS